MPFMVWNSSLSVGVEALDEDHKKLLGMVNNLHDAVQSGRGREALGKILAGLIDYTVLHFAREEKYLQENGYAEAPAHKREHADLTRQLLDVQAKYKAGASPSLSLEAMSFLNNWLVNHIQGSDQKYAAHLSPRGSGRELLSTDPSPRFRAGEKTAMHW